MSEEAGDLIQFPVQCSESDTEEHAGSTTSSPNASPGKNSEKGRQRRAGAAQLPDFSSIHTGVERDGASGGSDFFRPRAGSDSRAAGVLGKMASMTRTRWRSGEQPLQHGQSPGCPGVSQTVHGVSDTPSGQKNRSVFDIFPKNFRPRSKSDAAGKMKRPKAGSSETGRQSGNTTPSGRNAEHGRSPPPTPVSGVNGGGSDTQQHGGNSTIPNTSPYTTYHGGMWASGPQRSQKAPLLRDLFADPRALLAQDRRSRLSLHGFSERFELENVADNQVFVKFMKSHRCHDVIPDGDNNKLIVFDTQLKVQKAFFALMEHGIRAAPLWDSSTHDFVGMLTISDFITILQKYYRSPLSSKNDIKSHMIATWRDVLKNHNERIAANKLVHIGPDATLYDAIKMLHDAKIHRLAVMDSWSGNVIQILTHKRLLRFLFQFNHELPRPTFVFKSIQELGVGTYEKIITVTPETPLINALNKFCKHRVSSLPVVEKDQKLVDIYAKYDTIKLASNQTYNNLDITIRQALQYGNEKGVGGPYTCRKEESLQKVMERIVRCNVHRLVIVDDHCRVEGVISLSDIVVFIVLHQEELIVDSDIEKGVSSQHIDGGQIVVNDVFPEKTAAANDDVTLNSNDPSLPPPPDAAPALTTTTTVTSIASTTVNSHAGSKSPSPTNRPALKLYVPPQPLLQLQQQYRHDEMPPSLEKTPSPMRETFQRRSSPSTAAEEAASTTTKLSKGKKSTTPLRKKSIVDDIIPEFPTAIDLNIPELV